MDVIVSAAYVAAGFLGAEPVSWLIHRYIMHGLLWRIHRSHHVRNKGPVEHNDVFTLLFGTGAALLVVLNAPRANEYFFLGLGVVAYGVAYFILHDVMIHRRYFRRLRFPRWEWLRTLHRAHLAHHASTERMPSVSFGLLLVPRLQDLGRARKKTDKASHPQP